MRRAIAIAVFAVAAGASALAASGVAVPAHRMPPGTPAVHVMPAGALRLGFFIDPADHIALAPKMDALHGILAAAGVAMPAEMHAAGVGPAGGPVLPTTALATAAELGLALALLTILIPRLPRPSLRPLALVAAPAICATGRAIPPTHGPPRG